MKWSPLLCLAPAVSAFVVPNQQVFQQIDAADEQQSLLDEVKSSLGDYLNDFQDKTSEVKDRVLSSFNDALQSYSSIGYSLTDEAFGAAAWVEESVSDMYDAADAGLFGSPDEDFEMSDEKPEPPHHKHPKHPDHPKHPKHGKPDHDLSNLTIYQVIAQSKYTTKLAELLDDYPELKKSLNSTKHNHTIFVPIDAAFEKIPKHAPKPTQEQLEQLLSYHVVPGVYPALRVLGSHTLPTLLGMPDLADEDVPQRLSVHLGLKGLTLNFYSRVVGANFFAKNGVIHAVDSILVPPPLALKIVELLPSEFSTLELGLTKTGLNDELDGDHKGGTFFAPTNFAFAKLGPRINAFLFSKYGEKYLKALIKYHLVPHTVLYSDAVYTSSHDDGDESIKSPKKGYKHFDLPTLLEDKNLNVDVVRYGAFISIKINGFVRVTAQDGIAKDGVIHAISDVLIPPKTKGDAWVVEDAEMSVEEFKARFEGVLEE